ncbi:apicomplexan specific protein [Babesia ovata]|uniref:Apicomplexan specific protein n=1 Tax=Babesia ovata TaxID=189622 RepID=A0A2H6KCH1_9APIC|nr:apicomplexan specific protein [Babesia ovata]GBE60696.1 apicomplexan specific protein [Babesia ovata]
MSKSMLTPVTRDEIREALRDIIKLDGLQNTSLLSMREELSRRFRKPAAYFDGRREEVNELILETLTEMYGTEQLQDLIKSEGLDAGESDVKLESLEEEPDTTKRTAPTETIEVLPSVISEPGDEVEKLAKRAKQNQANIMTRSEFMKNAPKLKVQIEDSLFNVAPRTFSTDSCGWYLSEKVKLDICGQTIICQVGLNCTVVGSKQWKA